MRRHDKEIVTILVCLLFAGVMLVLFSGLSVDGQWKTRVAREDAFAGDIDMCVLILLLSTFAK